MIKVYSNGCPKCKILERELLKHEIEFGVESTDFSKLIFHNIFTMPVIELENGTLIKFDDAILQLKKGGGFNV